MPGLSRRTFLKGAAVVAAAPLVNGASAAEPAELRSKSSNTYKILTCNIRVALPEDDKLGFGWGDRRKVCINIMRKQAADLIGLQEVLKVQNDDLKKALSNYSAFGFDGPEMDAFTEGYHGIAKNPIFFLKSRFELLTGGTFWLSETPLIGGSSSWGTARARHANWVRLLDKRSGKEIRVINLHLDHQSQPAREKQIALVLNEAKQYQSGLTQILTGDFNAGANNPVYGMVKDAGWKDSYTAIHGEAEPGFTVHQFKGEQYEKKALGKKIDFIFTLGSAEPQSATIVKDSEGGRYPSDHYFVSAEVKF